MIKPCLEQIWFAPLDEPSQREYVTRPSHSTRDSEVVNSDPSILQDRRAFSRTRKCDHLDFVANDLGSRE